MLVLLTDMTAYADAMKEMGVAQERIPATRGYMGDLYTQLAQRYEKACDFKGAGSVTILTVTTMPGVTTSRTRCRTTRATSPRGSSICTTVSSIPSARSRGSSRG